MIRDRLIDVAELVYAVLRAILASASPDTLPLPRGEEAAEWTLVVVVGGGFTALILHGVYDLSGLFL